MNSREFAKVLSARIDKMNKVLSAKAEEYATCSDRFHNFKVAARLSSKPITPEQALFGMMRKHLVSVIDIIDGLDDGKIPAVELVDEKIGDSVNYLCLLEGMLIERITDKKTKQQP